MYVQSTNLAALVIVPVYLHCKFMEIFLGFIIYFQIYFWKIKKPFKKHVVLFKYIFLLLFYVFSEMQCPHVAYRWSQKPHHGVKVQV